MHRKGVIALYAVGVLATGVWSDLASDGRTDFLRDLLSTGIVLVFGAIVGDAALSVEETIYRRRGQWPKSKPLFILRVMTLSIGWVMLGHLLTPGLAMLVQVPRVGFDILPTIVLGLEFALRQALMPATVIGASVGVIVGLGLQRWDRHRPA